jgi:hypothetical protein
MALQLLGKLASIACLYQEIPSELALNAEAHRLRIGSQTPPAERVA